MLDFADVLIDRKSDVEFGDDKDLDNVEGFWTEAFRIEYNKGQEFDRPLKAQRAEWARCSGR